MVTFCGSPYHDGGCQSYTEHTRSISNMIRCQECGHEHEMLHEVLLAEIRSLARQEEATLGRLLIIRENIKTLQKYLAYEPLKPKAKEWVRYEIVSKCHKCDAPTRWGYGGVPYCHHYECRPARSGAGVLTHKESRRITLDSLPDSILAMIHGDDEIPDDINDVLLDIIKAPRRAQS